MTLVDEIDFTSHASPHTRTDVPVFENAVPSIVSSAPPASDVVLGEKLVSASCAPMMVGAPRALPQSELIVITWGPAKRRVAGEQLHYARQ